MIGLFIRWWMISVETELSVVVRTRLCGEYGSMGSVVWFGVVEYEVLWLV